jgi:beta propeller repeat protein
MRRLVSLTALALLAAAPAAAQVTITGTLSKLTNGTANQADPAIDGDLVVFTDSRNADDDIYMIDLATRTEVQVTSGGGDQQLNDVSDGVVVFTDFGAVPLPNVVAWDSGSGGSTVLDLPGDSQINPGIGANIVAYEATVGSDREIAVYDLDTGATQLLTSTVEVERNPAVDGGLVVFERSASIFTESDVILYDLASNTETNLGAGRRPHVDAGRVVFDQIQLDGARDVVVYDVASGTSATYALPGDQAIAHVSGDILAFDDGPAGARVIRLLHLPSSTVHTVSSPSTTDNFLNDVDGNRLVYTGRSATNGDLDIFLYTFTVDDGTTPPTTEDPCEDDSGLTELFSGEYVRTTGAPNDYSDSFSNGGYAQGVAVVESDCSAAIVELNGQRAVSPNQLDGEAGCGFGGVYLDDSNTLDVEVRSSPGCSVTITVYGVDDDVAAESSLQPASCDSMNAVGNAPFAAFALLLLVIRRRRTRS